MVPIEHGQGTWRSHGVFDVRARGGCWPGWPGCGRGAHEAGRWARLGWAAQRLPACRPDASPPLANRSNIGIVYRETSQSLPPPPWSSSAWSTVGGLPVPTSLPHHGSTLPLPLPICPLLISVSPPRLLIPLAARPPRYACWTSLYSWQRATLWCRTAPPPTSAGCAQPCPALHCPALPHAHARRSRLPGPPATVLTPTPPPLSSPCPLAQLIIQLARSRGIRTVNIVRDRPDR